MADMVPAGTGVAIVAALAFEGGYLLQALDARRVDTGLSPASGLAALARKKRWLAGLALAGVGAVLQIAALRLAPLTVVQPALALGVVALVLVGGRVLGEPASGADVGAAFALAGGVAVLGIAAAGLEEEPASDIGTVIALIGLGSPVVAGMALRPAPPWLLLAAAGGGDAVAAIAAKKLADAIGTGTWPAAAAWLALAAGAIGGSLACEMAALKTWPATRVGPFVLVCQTAIPVLLAPIVAGEHWGSKAPLVLVGLAIVACSCAWLARSAGLLEGGEAVDEDVGRERQPVP